MGEMIEDQSTQINCDPDEGMSSVEILVLFAPLKCKCLSPVLPRTRN